LVGSASGTRPPASIASSSEPPCFHLAYAAALAAAPKSQVDTISARSAPAAIARVPAAASGTPIAIAKAVRRDVVIPNPLVEEVRARLIAAG
jgi:hypothetical protein